MNKLTFIKVVGKNSHGSQIGEFRCDCGKIIKTLVLSVKNGHAKSCGCIRIGMKLHALHNMSETKFYGVYKTIKSRCTNKNTNCYQNYGGRGIKFLWKDFKHFRDDMFADYEKHIATNENTSIDRIDNDGNYCKENCRWVTRKEQNMNKRTNDNYTINGVTKCRSEWAREYGLTPQRVSARINRDGWTIEQALGTKGRSKKYFYRSKS